jgi:hypothetical protein
MQRFFALSTVAVLATASPSFSETYPAHEVFQPAILQANSCHPRHGCPNIDDHAPVERCLSFIAMIYGIPCEFL